jgi:hypothetical protein
LQLLNNNSKKLKADGNILEWATELKPFGVLRDGISQVRLRKNSSVADSAGDIIGRLEAHPSNPNLLVVDIDTTTLPTNTLVAVDGIIDPSKNYPGDGTVPAAALGQRYIIMNDVANNPVWANSVASKHDIIEYNGSSWNVSFDSSANAATNYLTNVASGDQLEWNNTEWVNSYEGIYNSGFWRVYL